MLRFAVAVTSVAAVLAFPSGALADHTDFFASARDGQSDMVLDEETFDDNVDFGTEAGELLSCGTRNYGSTAWFRFTAERSGPHTVTTFGSNFDTVLSVYEDAGGAIPDVGERIDCLDDADGANDRTSFVDFDAQAGDTYYAQVGGFDDGATVEEGAIVIAAYQPPANNARANAEPVGLGGGVFGYNFNASEEPGETTVCPGPNGPVNYSSTAWYRVTAPAIGDASVTVISTDMDPVVAVFPAGSNTPIGCNDDGPGQTTSAVLAGRVSPGEYFIQVGGVDGEQGTFEVRVTFVADNDLDDDGVSPPQDCNDGNAGIKPGAPEQVNNDVDENCDNVKEFDRDGDGSRVPGSPADCDDANPARSPLKPEVLGNRVDENCDGVATPYPVIVSRLVSAWDLGKVTRLRELIVFNARRGSTVTLRCRGKGCHFKSKRVKVRKNARQLKLQNRFTRSQRRFGKGARMIIRMSAPFTSPKETIYRMRPGRVPARQDFCITDRRRKC